MEISFGGFGRTLRNTDAPETCMCTISAPPHSALAKRIVRERVGRETLMDEYRKAADLLDGCHRERVD
jgi:hypothetical protein